MQNVAYLILRPCVVPLFITRSRSACLWLHFFWLFSHLIYKIMMPTHENVFRTTGPFVSGIQQLHIRPLSTLMLIYNGEHYNNTFSPKYHSCHHISRHHDDVIKWKHFPRYCPFVRGINRSSVNSPHQGQSRGALMFSLICAWINGWVNNRDAGDLRCHRAHYEVIVMKFWYLFCLVITCNVVLYFSSSPGNVLWKLNKHVE